MQFVVIKNQNLQLLPEKCIFWQEQKTLILADLHFGKAASFRHRGIPIPEGNMQEDLARLQSAIDRTKPNRILLLGDFFHTRSSQSKEVIDALHGWRERNRNMQVTLIRGNHDLHAGDPPIGLRILSVQEPLLLEPFAFCHHPQVLPEYYALSGHLHPGIKLHDPFGPSLRLPCFLLREDDALLPAFCSFAGMQMVQPHEHDRVYPIHEGRIFPWPFGRKQNQSMIR